MKWHKFMLSVVTLITTIVVFNTTISHADPVVGPTLSGKIWAQVSSVTSVSWDELNDIYDNDTGLLDKPGDTEAGGIDFSGWSWASSAEVAAMLNAYHVDISFTHPDSFEESNSEWAPLFLTDFTPTETGTQNTNDFEMVNGITRDSPSGGDATRVEVRDWLVDGTPEDRIRTEGEASQDVAAANRGVWIYAATSVPEPTLGLLLGISLVGLVGVGAVRRVKQRKIANS